MWICFQRQWKGICCQAKIRGTEKKKLGSLRCSRISQLKIIKKSLDNKNSFATVTYKQIPNEIEKNTLSTEADREKFNFSSLRKTSQKKIGLKDLAKIFTRKKNQSEDLCSSWEKKCQCLLLESEKKGSPGKFYKSNVDSKSYFSKEETFLIRNIQKIDKNFFIG